MNLITVNGYNNKYRANLLECALTCLFVQSLASSWLAERNALSLKVTPIEDNFGFIPLLVMGYLSEMVQCIDPLKL